MLFKKLYGFRCRDVKWLFPWILSVSYGKEGVCCRDENIVRSSILFNAYSPFDLISNYNMTNLGTYMLEVDNRNTRTRCETCLKLKLKNKFTRTTLSNGVLLSLLLILNAFLTCFYCWPWTSKWQMGMLRMHFNNCCTSDHQ